MLASSGFDGSIATWNLLLNNMMFMGIRDFGYSSIICIKWLGPGTNFLATSSQDGLIRIYDSSSLKFIKCLSGHTSSIPVNAIEVLADGRLATGSSDATMKIWNINKATSPYIPSFNSEINGIKQLPDGRLAIVEQNGPISFWDLDNNQVVSALNFDQGVKLHGISLINRTDDKLATSIGDNLEIGDYNMLGRRMTNISLGHEIACFDSFGN